MKIVIGLAAIGAACIGSALPASAQDNSSLVVRYHDLDLGSERGARELNRRIARSIRLVCGEPADPSLFEKTAARSCREQAAKTVASAHANAVAEARGKERGMVAMAQAQPGPGI